MACLLGRSAVRVLRRSLPQGAFRRQPFLENPRLYSSDGVNKHSCTIEKTLAQRIDNSLTSIEANIAECSPTQRATSEKLEVILQKEIENELAEKKRERVVLSAFAVLGIALCAGEYYLVESRRNSQHS